MVRKNETKSTNSNSPLAKARAVLKTVLKDEDPVVNLDLNALKESIPHIPTGSIIVDYLIGGKPNHFGVAPCPGLPRGKITNVYGGNSCGKTTLCLTASASVIKMGGTVCYIDWENEVAPDYAAALGVPIGDADKFLLVQPNTLEDGMKIAYTMASSGVDLIIFDSVGAGVPEDLYNLPLEEQGKIGRVGLLAGKWSAFLPRFKSLIAKTGTAVVAIAQIRKAINTMGYGDDTTVQGGEAWKFYSSVRVKLARIKQEKRKEHNAVTHQMEDVSYGGVIRAKLEKCKVSSAQGAEQDYYIRWGTGIDDIRSMIDVATNHGIIKKGGAWLTWNKPDGTQSRWQGVDKMRQDIINSPADIKLLTSQALPLLSAGSGSRLVDSNEEEATPGDAGGLDDLDDVLSAVSSVGKSAPLMTPVPEGADD